MISEKIAKVSNGQRMTLGLVNSIIGRIEYANSLLVQYNPVAGKQMYVEPHFDGTRISYLTPVLGGARPSTAGGGQPPVDNSQNLQNLIRDFGQPFPIDKEHPENIDRIRPFIEGGYTINLYDVQTIYGSNARLVCTMTGGGGIIAGYLSDFPQFAWWYFAKQFPGPQSSIVNPPPLNSEGSLNIVLLSWYFGEPPDAFPEFFPTSVVFGIQYF